MFIYRENALKRPSTYIIIVLYKEITLKKTLIQNGIKIFIKTHQIAHFFETFSRGSMPLSMCAADIINFLYERNNFFIQNAIKIYTKTHKL